MSWKIPERQEDVPVSVNCTVNNMHPIKVVYLSQHYKKISDNQCRFWLDPVIKSALNLHSIHAFSYSSLTEPELVITQTSADIFEVEQAPA